MGLKGKKNAFFERNYKKSEENIWSVPRKYLPLHSQFSNKNILLQ